MYCGEEITTKLNRDGIGWEDKEIKNVLNYYFYHPCKIVGRNLKGNIEIFSGIKKKEKKRKLNISVREFLDQYDQKVHGRGTRNITFYVVTYFW